MSESSETVENQATESAENQAAENQAAEAAETKAAEANEAKATESAENQPIETPEILAKEYRYIKLLGEGANGKTWLAININTGEKLAIKSLKLSQSENLKSFELFQREAEVLASVQIEGVPVFYKSIVSENLGGECYIVQQFVDAPSILDPLEAGRVFTEKETIKLIRQVAVILSALHKQYVPPIVHRDIKPSNILCSIPERGLMGQAYLIDFGAVANPQKKSGGSTVAGTYGYMAPEQMVGECTTASDLYSLGATALHMLTGKPPYEIEADVFRLKHEETIKKYAPETSEYMIKLIGQLLTPEAAHRMDDADELILKLDRVANGEDPDDVQKSDGEMTEQDKEAFNQLKAKFRRDSHWVTTQGTVYARTYRIHVCYEYTFTAKVGFFTKKDVFTSGLYPVKCMDAVFQNLTPQDFPLPCTVSYNPSNPRYNVLLSIDLKAKEKKPQVMLMK
ncbi:MAG: serine/threonine protein kinase [Proteobacteria bacterium]|nr:serine/threonine protein kinase [Pseudomonadota bacterium]